MADITYASDRRVGRMVAALLGASGAKQSHLAAAIGMDTGSMSRAINGRRHWTIDDLNALASFFDVPITRFFEDPDELSRQRIDAEQLPTGRQVTGRPELRLVA